MLWTIFVILLVLWLVGLVSSYTLGGFIHLLMCTSANLLIVFVSLVYPCFYFQYIAIRQAGLALWHVPGAAGVCREAPI